MTLPNQVSQAKAQSSGQVQALLQLKDQLEKLQKDQPKDKQLTRDVPSPATPQNLHPLPAPQLKASAPGVTPRQQDGARKRPDRRKASAPPKSPAAAPGAAAPATPAAAPRPAPATAAAAAASTNSAVSRPAASPKVPVPTKAPQNIGRSAAAAATVATVRSPAKAEAAGGKKRKRVSDAADGAAWSQAHAEAELSRKRQALVGVCREHTRATFALTDQAECKRRCRVSEGELAQRLQNLQRVYMETRQLWQVRIGVWGGNVFVVICVIFFSGKCV